MESNELPTDVRQQLREVERGEAAAWLSWAPRPWHSAFFSAWVVVFALNAGLSEDLGSGTVNLALAFAALGFMWVVRRRAGTYPDDALPQYLKAPVAWGTGVFLAVVVATWVLSLLAPWWLVAPLAAGVTYAAMEAYRRSYARAVEQVRARLEVVR